MTSGSDVVGDFLESAENTLKIIFRIKSESSDTTNKIVMTQHIVHRAFIGVGNLMAFSRIDSFQIYFSQSATAKNLSELKIKI